MQAECKRLMCADQQQQQACSAAQQRLAALEEALEASGWLCNICLEGVGRVKEITLSTLLPWWPAACQYSCQFYALAHMLPLPHHADCVQGAPLQCCSNRLCASCETAVILRHGNCPFCRTGMPGASSVPGLLHGSAPGGQQQQQLHAMPLPGATPGDGSELARLFGFMRAQLQAAAPPQYGNHNMMGTGAVDSSGSDSSGDASGDGDDSSDEDGYGERDNSRFYAAAAEVLAAACCGPSAECGLCGGAWLAAALAPAPAELLPGVLLCRSCWRNCPELAARPFMPGPGAAAAPLPDNTASAAAQGGSGMSSQERRPAKRSSALSSTRGSTGRKHGGDCEDRARSMNANAKPPKSKPKAKTQTRKSDKQESLSAPAAGGSDASASGCAVPTAAAAAAATVQGSARSGESSGKRGRKQVAVTTALVANTARQTRRGGKRSRGAA